MTKKGIYLKYLNLFVESSKGSSLLSNYLGCIRLTFFGGTSNR